MSRDLLFSIIVPVFNMELYLERCVESLLSQTYVHIEIILVDDGSFDRSPAICDCYEKQDDRVRVIHKVNGGLSDARNAGLLNASGKYILFVDSDDYLESDTCERFAIALTEEEDVVVAGTKMIDGMDVKLSAPTENIGQVLAGTEYLKRALKSNEFSSMACSNLYRKKYLLEKDLLFKVGMLHEDEQWTPRVFLTAEKVLITDIIFYNYLIREGSISNTTDFSYNAEHIAQIVIELDSLYDHLEDKVLKRALKDYLVHTYLFAFVKASATGYPKGQLMKPFVLRNSYRLRNRIKSILFVASPRLYAKIINFVRNY